LLGFGAGGGAVAAAVLALGIGQVTQGRACAAVLSAAATGGTSAQTATHYVLQGLPNCSYSPPAGGLYVAPLPGPVSVEVKQGASQYWLALLADNTGNPLTSVQVETVPGH
jgi:hypothetical protein